MNFKRFLKTNVVFSFVTTLLILSIIDFSFVPQTNSKFKTSGGPGEDGIALEYQVGLYPLYREGATYTDEEIPNIIPDIENLTFDIEFSFPRQAAEVTADVNENNKDTYTFNTPLDQGCTVTKVNGASQNSISFEKPAEQDELITVNLHCNNSVKPVNGIIKLSVAVREAIGNEKDFPYTDYSFVITEDYYNEFMEISNYSNPYTVVYIDDYINTTELSEKFVGWVNWYIEENGYEDYESQIKQYLHISTTNGKESVDTSYIVDTGGNWNTEILGFTKTGSYRKGFTYSFDNLLGYIRTSTVSVKKTTMYFYTTNKDTIDAAFNHYLKDAEFTEAEIESIIEYLDKRGGISGVIIDDNKILGLRYNPDEHRLILDSKLLEYAESLKNIDADAIEFQSKTGMLARLNELLEEKDFISTYLKGTVDNETDGAFFTSGIIDFTAIRKNNTNDYNESTFESFVDYYAIEDVDNDYYIVFKAFSDYSKSGNRMNYYSFQTLSFPVKMSDIAFENLGEDELLITLTLPKTSIIDGVSTTVDRTLAEDIFYNTVLPTLEKEFPDASKENSTIYERSTSWIIMFEVSKGYQDLIPSTNGAAVDEDSSELENNVVSSDSEIVSGADALVQESIESIKNASNVISSNVTGGYEVNDNANLEDNSEEEQQGDGEVIAPAQISDAVTEETSSYGLVSSIMRFVLK